MRALFDRSAGLWLRAVAARLEAGQGPPLPWLGRPPTRAVELPAGVRVIGVGGALLGGSGRTPLALAIAEHLLARGRQVALLGHGSAAAARGVRQVAADARLEEVGDEALLAAQRLQALGGQVWIGADRSAVLRAVARAWPPRAHRAPPVVVVDGLLQTGPRRLDLSVLVGHHGSELQRAALFPRGDLRAPLGQLTAVADVCVQLGPREAVVDAGAEHAVTREVVPAHAGSAADCGLFLAVARPQRVVDRLAAAGHRFRTVLLAPDHRGAWLADLARERARDLHLRAYWLTEKCAVATSGVDLGAPRVVLGLEVDLPAALRARLDTL